MFRGEIPAVCATSAGVTLVLVAVPDDEGAEEEVEDVKVCCSPQRGKEMVQSHLR